MALDKLTKLTSQSGITTTIDYQMSDLTVDTITVQSGGLKMPVGMSTFQNVTVTGDLTVNGTTTTLDTDLIGVDKLEVSGNNTTAVGIITQAGSGDILRLYDNTTQAFTVQDGGRVLIGTTTEGFGTYGEDLTIGSSDHAGITLRTGTGHKGTIYFSDGTSGAAEYKGSVQYDHSDDSLRFAAGDGTEKVRITSAGRVGIGTVSPNAPLDVYKSGTGTVVDTIITRTSGGGAFAVQCSDIAAANPVWALRTYAAEDLVLSPGGHADANEKVRIKASTGRVGIGEDSPDTNLHVKGTGTDILKIESTDAGAQGANLILQHSPGSGNMADNDVISLLQFNGVDDSNNATTYASIRAVATDVSNNTEKGDLTFFTRNGGTFGERLRIDKDGCVRVGNTHNQTTSSNTKRIALGGKGSIWGWVSGQIDGSINFADNYYWDGANNRAIEAADAAYLALRLGSLRFGTTDSTPSAGGVTGLTEKFRITKNGTVNIGGNFTQTTYKAQIQTGTNKFISFGNAAHDDLGNEGSGIFFSRQSDGSKELSSIFGYGNTSLGIAARADISLHAGGSSTYGAAPERLRITSAGKVGINSTSPTYALEVDGGTQNTVIAVRSSDAKAAISFLDATSAGYGRATIGGEGDEVYITSGGGYERIRFGTGGNNVTTGINTTGNLVTGSEVLSVRGYSSFKSTSKDYAAIYTHNEGNTSGSYNAHILWNAGGANRGGIGYMPNNGEVIINNQNALIFATGGTHFSGTERLRIKSDGKVGINSTAPNKLLDVHSTNTNTYSSADSNTPSPGSVIQLTNKSGTDGSGSGYYSGLQFSIASGATSSGWFTFHRTGDNKGDFTFTARNAGSSYPELMRIKSTGEVCIGRNSAVVTDTKLNIECDATKGAIAIQCGHTNTDTDLITAWNSSGKNIVNITAETDNSPYLKFQLWSTTTNTAVERFRVNHLGNVAIGGGIAASNRLEITDDPKGFPSDSAQPNASFLIKHGTSGSNRRWVGIGASLTGAWIQSSSPGGSGLSAPLWINKGGGDVTLGNDKLKVTTSGNLEQNGGSGISYFKGSGEYIFGSNLSSPPSGGSEANVQIHAHKTRAQFSINGYMNNAGGPFMQFVSSRSGTLGTLGTKCQSNDYLGEIRFMGDNATNYNSLCQGASIYAQATSTPADGDTVIGGRLYFATGSGSAGSVNERFVVQSNGSILAIPRKGYFEGAYIYRQRNQSQNYEHRIRGPHASFIELENYDNCSAEITVNTIGTSTRPCFCKYRYTKTDGTPGTGGLTHIAGGNGANSNVPYMVISSNQPRWKMDHSGGYYVIVRVVITGGDNGETYTSTGEYFAN